MLKQYARAIYNDWAHQCEKRFLELLETNPNAKILDLGCGNGVFTKIIARKIQTKKVSAIEGLKVKISGIHIIKGNLNRDFPLPSGTFDVVTSSYSIEHLYNTASFIFETKRVLKKGGYTVIATDNLSSWANITALLFGFQAFSSGHNIKGIPIGNPYAVRYENTLNYGLSHRYPSKKWKQLGEFEHNKVHAYQTLVDSYKAFGFSVEKVYGAGYFPFGGQVSEIFSTIDPRHSHLLVMKARKI